MCRTKTEAVLRSRLPVAISPAGDALSGAWLQGTRGGEVVAVAAGAAHASLVSATDVDVSGDGLQMTRPYTPSVATQVIQFEAVGDRTDEECVDGAVCQRACDTDPTDLPVPVGVEASGPAPASTTNTERLRPALVYQAQHVGRRRRRVSAPLVEHPPVVALAHPSAQSPRATFIIVNRASHGAYPTLPTGGTR